MFNQLKKLWVEEKGQGMAEYGLILALVAIIVAAALVTLQGGISATLNNVASELGGGGE